MRINRFYSERTNLREGSSVKLADSDINHIRKVLRLKKGDEIIIFNGEKEYLAKLDLITSEVAMATILKQLRVEIDNNKVEITLFQGLLRAGKFDEILERTTELGIDFIVPMECEFSQSKVEHANEKTDRWNKILIAASKQSERIKVPTLIQPMRFKETLEHLKEFDKIYFFTTRQINLLKPEKNIQSSHKRIAYFIGPEGGFSPKEHEIAKEHGIEFYTISGTILRSETAAIFGAGLLNFLYN